jgi:hypothetical protein
MKFILTTKKVLVISFLVGLIVRLFIELQSPYPVGEDVPLYAYTVELYVHKLDWDVLYLSTPLVPLIGYGFKILTNMDSLTIWKFISPVLNGLVGVSFAFFLMKGLKWSLKKTLFTVVFLLVYFVQILFSDGLFSQQLGTFFFLLTLTYYLNNIFRNTLFCSILTVLSHQMMPVLLFCIILLDTLKKLYKKESLNKNTFLLLVIPFGMFLIIFFLPALSSNNVLGEVWEHVSGYLFFGAYGRIIVYHMTEPLWLQMLNHFLIYCGMLICFVIIGLFSSDIMLLWTFSVVVFSFLPFGTIWKRWQWLLTYPFVIFTTNGLFSLRNFKYSNFLKYLILIITVVYSLLYSVLPNTMINSSISYDNYPYLVQTYNFLSDNITNNSLIVTGYIECGYFESFLLQDNKETKTIRYPMLIEEDSNFYVYCTSMAGFDFYTFRQKKVNINILTYDVVYVIVNSDEKQYFNITKDYTKVNQFGEIEVYELHAKAIVES